jgi:hypothetical protein
MNTTTTFSRRRLLSATAIVPVVVALNACAGLTASQVAAQAVSDVKLIASGLAGALPSLGTAAGIPVATVAAVGQAIANIQTVADGVASAASNIDAQPLVQQLESLLNGAVGALAGLALPPPFGPALTAAMALLPVIESVVGLLTAPKAAASAMSPDTAREILAGAAGR